MPFVSSAHEAVAGIRSGMNVFVHGCAATPSPLLDALAARTDLHDVTLFHLHTEGTSSFLTPTAAEHMRSVSFFTGPAARPAVQDGRADFVPVFESQEVWDWLFAQRRTDTPAR